MNPGSQPRRGIAAALALTVVALVAVVAVVAGTPEQAAASGLEPFASCAELRSWGEAAQATMRFDPVGGVVMEDSGMAAAPTTVAPAASEVAKSSAGADASATGGTNVVVAGVDELDTVERLGDGRALIAAAGKVSLVDMGAGRVLDRWSSPAGVQLTYDPEAQVAWTVGSSADGASVEVHRLAVGDASLRDGGAWSTKGYLVTARRVGDRLHLVAADGFVGEDGTAGLPFGGAPVPCGEVLHPIGPSEPTATLLATLPVAGELAPLHTAEVVGSGQQVHVTTDAAYLATPLTDAAQPSTAIHRFDLGDLTHTGSGRVDGSLLNDFSMSERDGYLRVAVTRGGPSIGRPIPMTDDVVEPAGSFDVVSSNTEGDAQPGSAGPETTVAPSTTEPELTAPPKIPETTVPEATVPEPTVPDTTVPEPTTTVVGPTTTEPELTAPPATVPTTIPGQDDPRNRVVVLDTEGDLDQVGATPWFGHPGETLQGIRFDGATAYAVTFLNTDPFYVLDLSSPTAPTVAGEVELPGFSSYLHPVAPGLVVGFGPGADGRATAKLFDVSDASAPRVVDSTVLGDESPVVYDYHAFVDLGDGRFAVPASAWGPVSACPGGPAVDVVCPGAAADPQTSVVELRVEGDQLREVRRVRAALPQPASRAIPTDAGWALLAEPQLAFVDRDGTATGTVSLG